MTREEALAQLKGKSIIVEDLVNGEIYGANLAKIIEDVRSKYRLDYKEALGLLLRSTEDDPISLPYNFTAVNIWLERKK